MSEQTLKSYQKDVFGRWMKYVGDVPRPDNINQLVIAMREAGLSPTTCNITVRSLSSFLTWLYEKGFPYMRLKQLRVERKVMRTVDDKVLSLIVVYKGKTPVTKRTHAILCTLIDCGFRVSEVLSLRRENVDFENLLIKVTGKGAKERIAPMSVELRKILYRYQLHERSKYFFMTKTGNKLTYNNLLRDSMGVFDELGIKKDFDGMFHMFRRKYARNYLKQGGNLI